MSNESKKWLKLEKESVMFVVALNVKLLLNNWLNAPVLIREGNINIDIALLCQIQHGVV